MTPIRKFYEFAGFETGGGNKPIAKTKEKIIESNCDSRFCIGMPFNLEMLDNMLEQYATYISSEKCKEIERLKGLIKNAHRDGYSNGYFEMGENESWNEFKQINNL